MTGRELAWRVLAQELRASSEEEKGGGAKTPSFVITPLGGRMNRVAMAGTIAPAQRVGADPSAGFLRSQLTDPTGSVSVTAGSFQPIARLELEGISHPASVLLVGKATLFRGAGTLPVPSVRAEEIHPISDPEYREFIAEAASQTAERIELVRRLRGANPPTEEALAKAGVSPWWVRGARAAVQRYPSLDPAPYYEGLRVVLTSLGAPPAPEPAVGPPPSREPTPSEVVRVRHPRMSALAPSISPGLRAMEGQLLEILDELADESPDGYADMDDLAERAARHGIEGERMEELLNYLSENGTLEEPLVGKFRRAEGPPPESH